jgi:hypothetical protein
MYSSRIDIQIPFSLGLGWSANHETNFATLALLYDVGSEFSETLPFYSKHIEKSLRFHMELRLMLKKSLPNVQDLSLELQTPSYRSVLSVPLL